MDCLIGSFHSVIVSLNISVARFYALSKLQMQLSIQPKAIFKDGHLDMDLLNQFIEAQHFLADEHSKANNLKVTGLGKIFYRKQNRALGFWQAKVKSYQIKLIEKQVSLFEALITNHPDEALKAERYFLHHKLSLDRFREQITQAIKALALSPTHPLTVRFNEACHKYRNQLAHVTPSMGLLEEIAQGKLQGDGHLNPLYDYFESLHSQPDTKHAFILQPECQAASNMCFTLLQETYDTVYQAADNQHARTRDRAIKFLITFADDAMRERLARFAEREVKFCLEQCILNLASPNTKRYVLSLQILAQYFASPDDAKLIKLVVNHYQRYHKHNLSADAFERVCRAHYQLILAEHIRRQAEEDVAKLPQHIFALMSERGFESQASHEIAAMLVERMVEENKASLTELDLPQNSSEYQTVGLSDKTSDIKSALEFWACAKQTVIDMSTEALPRVIAHQQQLHRCQASLPESIKRHGLFAVPQINNAFLPCDEDVYQALQI